MTEPTNPHELEAWLRDRPPEFAVAIAARIAIRSVPYLVEALHNHFAQRRAEFLLPSLCALAGASFAARWPHRANDARKVVRRIARDLRDAFAEQDEGIRISLIKYQEIYEPPSGDLVRDARAFPLSERAILASVYAAQAAADSGDVAKGLANRSSPADAAMECFRVACRNRSDGDGAAYPEIEEDIDEDDAEFDTESLDAALADARHLEDALTESQSVQRAVQHLSATPLWPVGPPIWAGRKWTDLVDELPDGEQWRVWTNWYEAHLAATPLNEVVEYARATVGQNIAEGVVAVNTTLAETIQANTDPLALAVEQGLRGADALSDRFDFNEHCCRIQRALPEDPAGVVGAAKDMLESVMKTILQRRGRWSPSTKITFPTLVKTCLEELGLQPRSKPTSPADRHARKFASTAGDMIKAINKLRNDAGTGHGRPESSDHESQAFGLSAADARLAAATSLILSAWLLHHDTDS